MKSCLSFLVFAAVVFPLVAGCEPRPVVEQPPAVEQPAVDVDVSPSAPPTTPNENTGVDVEVGSGQGVQVDVNETPAQQ